MKNGVSSAFLKNLAIILMLINHWFDILVMDGRIGESLNIIQYCLTRGAFVIFAFQLAESIDKTSNKKKFLLRLLILAIISELPFDIVLKRSIINLKSQNVFWTLFFAASSIMLIKNVNSTFLKHIIVLITFVISVLFRADYGLFGIMLIYTFYFMKNKKEKYLFVAILLFLGVGINSVFDAIIFNEKINFDRMIFNMLMEFSGVLILPIVALYNGKKGKQLPKILYYLFYPVHLIVGKIIL